MTQVAPPPPAVEPPSCTTSLPFAAPKAELECQDAKTHSHAKGAQRQARQRQRERRSRSGRLPAAKASTSDGVRETKILRGLAYLHSLGIRHGDVKPENILIGKNAELKLCDLSMASFTPATTTGGATSTTSLFYRAPEVILRSGVYTNKTDNWAAGCILAELLAGRPLFVGRGNLDQLGEIIEVLGSPSESELMVITSRNTLQFPLPKRRAKNLEVVLQRSENSDEISLIEKLLKYKPEERAECSQSLEHPFFDELRRRGAALPTGESLPRIFHSIVDVDMKGS